MSRLVMSMLPTPEELGNVMVVVKCEDCGDRFYLEKEVLEYHDNHVECDLCGGQVFQDDNQEPVKHQTHCNLGMGFR